jgi:RNA polymerase sigma-70 factor (ECF subfamily)
MSTSLRDPQIFDRAYREYRPGAFAAALRIVRDPAAAEDVVQEVFVQLWRRPQSFDERRGSLGAYVTMLARSRAIDHWRAQAVREQAVERLHAGHEVLHERSAADRAIERERSARVVSIVDRLPDRQREAVLLAYANGLSAREIAAVVGVPPGTIKSRLRLGLEKLRGSAA